MVRAVTDEIMYEILRLSGQEYVDAYAAVVKAAEAGDEVPARKFRRRER